MWTDDTKVTEKILHSRLVAREGARIASKE